MTLPDGLKRLLLYSFSSLFAAGSLYWASRRYLRVAGEFGDGPHVLERLTGPLHLVAAFGFLFVVGMLWTQHVTVAIRRGKHRPTGWLLVGMVVFLAISGVALVYGGEKMQRLGSQLHPYFGFGLLPLLAFHWAHKSEKARSVNWSWMEFIFRRI
jgi:hypothetical protein